MLTPFSTLFHTAAYLLKRWQRKRLQAQPGKAVDRTQTHAKGCSLMPKRKARLLQEKGTGLFHRRHT
jgi:hypothetical protein